MADKNIQLKDRNENLLFPRVKLTNAVNDIGFITSAEVSSNYATKSEIADIISAKLSRVVVDALPTEDIQTNTIYMVPNGGSNSSNVYTEYLYTNNKWEIIGSTDTDLTGYATETYVSNYVASQGFATETYVSDYVGSQGFATQSWVTSQNYATESYVSSTYAPISNAALEGTPTAPNITSESSGTQIANKNYVEGYVNDMFLAQNLVYVVLSDSL
jgi:hypothetical protein